MQSEKFVSSVRGSGCSSGCVPRGRAVYEYHRSFHERMISSILDTLSPEQSAVLAQSLEKLQDFFNREEAAAEGETNG